METHVFEIYIKTTPERLWQAITDPEERAKYSFGVKVHSDWTPGSSYESKASWGPFVEEEDRSTSRSARTSRSTRRTAWSRPSTRCGPTR